MNALVGVSALALFAAAAVAQGTAADYRRAAELLPKWSRAAKRFDPQVRWLDEGGVLWFEQGRGAARRCVLVAADGSVRRAATPAELGLRDEPQQLEPLARWGRSRRGGPPA
ncbi:MAG: hypothetical protein ACON4Z_01775, partial [Planctomycetota bacterium]